MLRKHLQNRSDIRDESKRGLVWSCWVRVASNDSNAALRLSKDLLITGPTGTNVADVQILLLRD